MSGAFDDLPLVVEVDGVQFAVCTDFRDWIMFEQLLLDKTIDDDEKFWLLMDFYEPSDDKTILPETPEKAVDALMWFYLCGDKPKGADGKNETQVYDYEKDASMISAAFMQAYSINLNAAAYMHWWEFHALMINIPEDTRLFKAMGYRAMDISTLPKQERERYKNLKQLYALDVEKEALTLEERNAALLEKAREIRRRTEKVQSVDL